jgi:hypothetical protein
MFMREGKSRIINFEFTSLTTFGISSNFLTPDAIVSLIQKYGSTYSKRKKEWVLDITIYKECVIEITAYCKPRGIYCDVIPDSLFNLFEQKIPFSDITKENIANYDYNLDEIMKPRLT